MLAERRNDKPCVLESLVPRIHYLQESLHCHRMVFDALPHFFICHPECHVSAPLGETPVGYAVFDDIGHVFMQLVRACDQGIEPLHVEGVREALADSFIAYFGKYSVGTDGTRLTIRVEGCSRACHFGSVQERTLTLAEDALILGQPGQYARSCLDSNSEPLTPTQT